MDRGNRGLRFALLGLVAVGVAAIVWASNRADWTPTHISGVTAGSGSADVSVTVEHSRCRRGPRVRVLRETADQVRLRAEQDEGGDCDDIGLTSEIDVRLGTELGARSIEVEQPRPSNRAQDVSCVVDGQADGRCVVIVLP